MRRTRSDRITVLVFYNRISLFYTLAPLLLCKDVARQLDFTQSLDYCLRNDRNRHLMIVRYFEGVGLSDGRVDEQLMTALREKYDRIAFFDDSDGAGCTRFDVLPYVDLYLKKQLLKNREDYRRQLYGRQWFSDYYHRIHGVTDEQTHGRATLPAGAPLDKIRVAWNLGVGSFPVQANMARAGVALARYGGVRSGFLAYRQPLRYRAENRETYDVLARFGVPKSRSSVAFQRKLLLEKVGGHSRFLTGRVGQREYNREIRNSKITLSPFGCGEVCFRDFEAVLNDSLLLKPRMDHLETWPDIFRPGETYVPISWDGDDVVQTAAAWLADDHRRHDVVAAAKAAYTDALRQAADRARTVVGWLVNAEDGKHKQSSVRRRLTSPNSSSRPSGASVSIARNS